MSKKQITGKDGKKYTVSDQNPWYRKKSIWFSVIGALVILFTLANIYSAHTTSEANDQDNYKSAISDTSSSEPSPSSSSKQSESKDEPGTTTGKLSDNTAYTMIDSKKYSPKTADTTWKSGNLSIKNVYIVKTKPFKYYDGESSKKINGIVIISYSYKSGEDVTLYDGQSKLSTSDGQQVDVDNDDSKDIGDIDKGVTKKGESVFLLENMSDASKISSVRWRFDASPQNKDDDDILHSFDFQIPLKS